MRIHASTTLQIVRWAVVATTARGHGLNPSSPLTQRQQQQSGAPVHLPLTWFPSGQKYMASILVGTPPQQQYLMLDQGLSWPFIFYNNGSASSFSMTSYYSDNNIYIPGNSTSFTAGTPAVRSDNTTWELATDTFSIGGYSQTVDNDFTLMNILNVSESSPEFDYMLQAGRSNGFLGLGIHQDTDFAATNLVQDMVAKLEQPVVGMYFGNWTPVLSEPGEFSYPSNNTEGAEILFGGTNQSFYQGAITYTNATTSWQTPLEGLTVNGQTITLSDMPSATNQSNILTAKGTSIGPAINALVFPPDVVTAIMAAIPRSETIPANDTTWAGRYLVPCNSSTNMVFTIGGQQYPMNPIYVLNLLVYDSARMMCISSVTPDTLQPAGGGGMTGYSLGVPFLRNVYTVYNYGTSQIGLAKLAAGLNTANISDLYFTDAQVGWDAPSGTTEPTASSTAKNGAATRPQVGGAVVAVAVAAALYMT